MTSIVLPAAEILKASTQVPAARADASAEETAPKSTNSPVQSSQ
jgi:hypothetical protein